MAPEFPFVDFCKVDVDDNQETAAQCGIRSMPTFKFFRNSVQVAEFSGADENRLRAVLAEHGGPPVDLSPSSPVVLFGLKAKPEANGRRGVVKSYDASKGRFAVELKATAGEDDGGAAETLALKRDNLMLACKVTFDPTPADGSASASESEAVSSSLGGATEGVLSGYLADRHAYFVKPTLAGGERGAEIEVPAACVRLPEGCAAVVIGLQGAPENNGKPCHVLGVHEESGRYLVALSATQQLRLKRSNLRA